MQAKVADRIRQKMTERNINQAALAKKAGMSRQRISQILNDGNATTENVKVIAQALKVDPESIDPEFSDRRSLRATTSVLAHSQGIDVEYLRAGMNGLSDARHIVLDASLDDVVMSAKGKSDTRRFDAWPENAIVHKLKAFNERSATSTEERMTRGNQYARVAWYSVDPFDRSRVFESLVARYKKKFHTVRELVGADEFKAEMSGVSEPFASITCVRDERLVYNAMLGIASGDIYVAFDDMIKWGNIDDNPDPETLAERGSDIWFEPRPGDSTICFLGEGDDEQAMTYQDIFEALGFRESQKPTKEHQNPGGPARILYLAQSMSDVKPAFVLSNGEKIGEWLGWLAYAIHSRDLAVYELSAEKYARDGVLCAPNENYSALVAEPSNSRTAVSGIKIDLGRITCLRNPSKYRGAIAVAHIKSSEINAKVRAFHNARELLPNRSYV